MPSLNRKTVTLGYEDLVALHMHADEVCPAFFDDTAARDESQRRIWNIMREHG
ncbi:hypothetical protein [Sphingosinicella sp. BN140058]|uniref:hypothetical protein n=1 Tax=Sphingosinicella sp. BN140058 TaxID=1892855 RepID=UPI0013ED4D78|nr:hypothetical protein [Sphingosinicella sp. BN140058]